MLLGGGACCQVGIAKQSSLLSLKASMMTSKLFAVAIMHQSGSRLANYTKKHAAQMQGIQYDHCCIITILHVRDKVFTAPINRILQTDDHMKLISKCARTWGSWQRGTVGLNALALHNT